jgi:hypothetical protein
LIWLPFLVRLAGFEPTTPWFVAGSSGAEIPYWNQQLELFHVYHRQGTPAAVSTWFHWASHNPVVQISSHLQQIWPLVLMQV